MLKSSANVFFFIISFLMSLIILSQETQVGHHYSPAPEPAAHEAGKAPGPIAPQPVTLPLYGATPGSLHPQECEGRCGHRCSATAYKKPCLFFCRKCCAACLCVPPGTYGNKQLCPCYNNWKTKRGGPKCP